jgi:hypothetical protein
MSELTVSDSSSGLLVDAAEVLLAANFAFCRALSEGLCATVIRCKSSAALLSATISSMIVALSGLDCYSSILGLFRLPLKLLCWGSTI